MESTGLSDHPSNMPSKKKKKVVKQEAKSPTPSPSPPSSDDGSKNKCICGDNDNTAKRPWFRCDACECFQHPDCMDRSIFADELEDHYLCEQCKPDEHVELLDAVARGERLWEARIALRLQTEAGIEKRILASIEQVSWFWEDYRPDWYIPPGMSLMLPPPPPAEYIDALKSGLRELLADLEVYVRRILAISIEDRVAEGSVRVLGVINKVIEDELDVDEDDDLSNSGLLAETLGRANKGKYWKCWKNVLKAAKQGWEL